MSRNAGHQSPSNVASYSLEIKTSKIVTNSLYFVLLEA